MSRPTASSAEHVVIAGAIVPVLAEQQTNLDDASETGFVISRQFAEGGPVEEGKYARVERERRFLLDRPPSSADVLVARRIEDRYLTGTRLRLRRMERLDDASVEFKLTQKIPADDPGPVQGLITTTYLSRIEYDVLAALPAAAVSKTRVSLPPLGIDVFDGALQGLIIAEAEFTSDADAWGFTQPLFAIAEVTTDSRFTGGRLAQTNRGDLLRWLAEYGITPEPSSPLSDR